MSLGREQEKFAEDFLKLGTKALELGFKIRFRELQRTEEQQRIYVKDGRSKTMNSMHLQSCAIDMYTVDANGKIVYSEELGRYWESLSPENEAGMFWKSFKDGPHYQRTVR
jgi:D-alanyl-D-alanine carboxypeptidase